MTRITIINRIPRTMNEWRIKSRSAMSQIGRSWLNNCTEVVPVDTGLLKSTLKYTIYGSMNLIILQLGANTHYAIYVHEGTYKMRARPYIKQPFDSNIGKFIVILKTAFDS